MHVKFESSKENLNILREFLDIHFFITFEDKL